MADKELDKPKSQVPKVAATGIAGIAAAFALWVWNKHQINTGGSWNLVEPYSGMFVTLVAWAAGPIIRWWQSLFESKQQADQNVQALREEVRDLASALRDLKQGKTEGDEQ